jgi:hypothetical protein
MAVVSDGESLQAGADAPITRPMKTFLNLRLSARLGAAFGFLVLALVVTTVVGLNGLGKVHGHADELAERDVAALEDLLTISQDFLASGSLVIRHLYVEDGDLEAEDRTAKEIEALEAEAGKSITALRPHLASAGAERALTGFETGLADFEAAAAGAIERSREGASPFCPANARRISQTRINTARARRIRRPMALF